MKTYEEMAQSVIRRAKAHRSVRNRWVVGSVAAVFALCICLSAMALRPQTPTLQEPPVTDAPKTEARVTFLYVEGEDITAMEQGVTVPCRSELRVLDVSGMTDAEIEAIAQEEQAYADALVAAYPEALGYGWIQYDPSGTPSASNDHLVATFVHAGHFILNVRDWSQVESIQASTKNSVLILPGLPSADSEDETDVFAYPQGREYCITGDELEQRYYGPYGGAGFDFALGSGVVKYLNENPIPLSQLSETFTFTVNFTDGTQETYTIDMIFNDNGEVYALYRGTTAVA